MASGGVVAVRGRLDAQAGAVAFRDAHQCVPAGTRPLERCTRSATGKEDLGRRGTAPPPATDERR
jgi:hypothetical protein